MNDRKLVLNGAGCDGYVLTISDEEGNSVTVCLTFEEGMAVSDGLMGYYKNHLMSHLAQAFTGLSGEELQDKLEATGPLPKSDTSWIDKLEQDLNHNDIEGSNG